MAVTVEGQEIKITGDGECIKNMLLIDFSECLNRHLKSDPLTRFVESLAADFVANNFPLEKTHFIVRIICAWGGLRGANPKHIYEQNSSDNFARLNQAIRNAREASLDGNYKAGIEFLRGFKGIRISFRSKILKFICPDHAVVLDSIIRDRLGYPESQAGYEIFVNDCITIRNFLNASGSLRDRGAPWRVSDVEMAIFMKVK
jgi:hypothetical protein